MRRQAFRWLTATIIFVVFGLIMWPIHQGIVLAVNAWGLWFTIPFLAIGNAFAWIAYRKGWLT